MRVLVTGVTGMAGSHLAEYLLSNHPDALVFGTYRWRSRMDNLQDLSNEGKVGTIADGGNSMRRAELAKRLAEEARLGALNLVECELTDAVATRKLIAAVRPDRIFHLAAQSYVSASWSAPTATLNTNVSSQVNLFEAVLEAGLDPVIHVAGSSEEYGLVRAGEVPIKESNPLRPLSTYAVSKVTQEMLGWQYNQSYGLRAVVTRGFNHTGPRRGQVFVTSNVAKQIAEIEAGQREPVVNIGDMTSQRDWSDVRDVVRAYWLAAEKGVPGDVYNVGSGVARSVGEMVDLLLSLAKVRIDLKQDPARMRPSDVKILLADVSKFRDQTGWQPEIPFARTMQDLLDYWRART